MKLVNFYIGTITYIKVSELQFSNFQNFYKPKFIIMAHGSIILSI